MSTRIEPAPQRNRVETREEKCPKKKYQLLVWKASHPECGDNANLLCIIANLTRCPKATFRLSIILYKENMLVPVSYIHKLRA